jgi:microcompartment protein CcmK/EutM
MRTAVIVGHITSTVKHPSFQGSRLLIAVPESDDVAPQVVIDPLGAAIGQRVIISSDGAESRKIVKNELSPARWNITGIIDPEGALAV